MITIGAYAPLLVYSLWGNSFARHPFCLGHIFGSAVTQFAITSSLSTLFEPPLKYPRQKLARLTLSFTRNTFVGHGVIGDLGTEMLGEFSEPACCKIITADSNTPLDKFEISM
ncbi:MAG: hypothetical protein HZB51_21055 [Chloroflexi bacterium]|nr:hypothetical protein [Chloroflexota bacterium]